MLITCSFRLAWIGVAEKHGQQLLPAGGISSVPTRSASLSLAAGTPNQGPLVERCTHLPSSHTEVNRRHVRTEAGW